MEQKFYKLFISPKEMAGIKKLVIDDNLIQKGYWLNNSKIIDSNLKKKKPCYKLGYCPYGCIVEAFPLPKKRRKISCGIFDHDCPMFYNAEDLSIFARGKQKKKEI